MVAATALGVGAYRGISSIYSQYSNRLLNVCVVTDIGYRQEKPNWQAAMPSLLAEVNRLFQGTGVQWRLTYGGDAYPPGVQADIMQRAALVSTADCNADVILGLTARTDKHTDAIASPFGHAVLIEDTSSDTEAMAKIAIARALAQLFGVPSASRRLVVADASQGIFDAASTQLIHNMRHYNFSAGISALPGKWEQLATTALTEFLNGKQYHPEAEAHRILGRAFAVGARHTDAARQYREAVRLAPDDARLHIELGTQLAAQSELDAALTEFRTAISLDSSSAEPHAAAGAVLLNADRIDEAVDELRQATVLEPGEASYRTALGAALSRQPGRPHEAAAAFEAALRLRPQESAAIMGLIQTSNLEESLGETVSLLEAEVKHNPRSAEAHLDLADALFRAGDLDAAEKEIRRALELQPNDGSAHTVLARAYNQAGRYSDADAELNAAQALGTTPPTSLVETVRRKLDRAKQAGTGRSLPN